MTTMLAPASDIKTQSREDFLMDVGLFSQLHLVMFLGDLPQLEVLQGAAEISLTFGAAHACRTQLGGKYITLSTSVMQNYFFCFTSSSPFLFFPKTIAENIRLNSSVCPQN